MKTRYPRKAALAVARELVKALTPVTERLIVAGSLRRKAQEVGDVEILFIPKFTTQPKNQADLFSENKITIDLAAQALDQLINQGDLSHRPNSKGFKVWGPKNKYAIHTTSGIPVDLFTATEENWYNYLVCRTGPAPSNMRIAQAAQRTGWTWNPYGPGFSNGNRIHRITSEEAVFNFVNLPYHPPHQRT